MTVGWADALGRMLTGRLAAPPWLDDGMFRVLSRGGPLPWGTQSGWEAWWRVLSLRDFNTRVVVAGAALLGIAAGVVGTFALLRKRSLMGDALSHAMLPGIGLAFIVSVALGGTGKSLVWLMAGGGLSGLIGVLAILAIRGATRLKDDAALGIVLSVFFGAGVAVLGVVQQMEAGSAAGLEAFIYGKAALMNTPDVAWIAGSAVLSLLGCGLLFKELKLLCFDEVFARARGFSSWVLDSALMGMIVAVALVGLQAVGLILIVALLVIPPAAARFWTNRLWVMIALAAGFGGASGALGAMLSAVFSDLPSGAMIVLVAGTLFFISLLGGAAHGTLVRAAQQWQLNRKVDRQHLLRAMYELRESERAFSTGTAATMDTGGKPVSLAELLPMRSWSARRLRRVIRRQLAEGTMAVSPTGEGFHLAPRGWAVAAELVRRHRLWELYLIERAEIAPSLVDRDADAIEHLLDAEMVARLEKMLAPARGGTTLGVPSSPHPIPLLPGEQQGPGPGGDT